MLKIKSNHHWGLLHKFVKSYDLKVKCSIKIKFCHFEYHNDIGYFHQKNNEILIPCPSEVAKPFGFATPSEQRKSTSDIMPLDLSSPFLKVYFIGAWSSKATLHPYPADLPRENVNLMRCF